MFFSKISLALISFKTTHIKCNLTFHGLSLWAFTAVTKHWMHLLAHHLLFLHFVSTAWTHILSLPQSLWTPTSVSCLVFLFPHFLPSPVQPTHSWQSNLMKNQSQTTDSAPALLLHLLPIKPHLSLLLYPSKPHHRPSGLRTASSVANAQSSLSA